MPCLTRVDAGCQRECVAFVYVCVCLRGCGPVAGDGPAEMGDDRLEPVTQWRIGMG